MPGKEGYVTMQAVERQAAAGVAEADSILLVTDGQQGLTASDEEIVSWLRRRCCLFKMRMQIWWNHRMHSFCYGAPSQKTNWNSAICITEL